MAGTRSTHDAAGTSRRPHTGPAGARSGAAAAAASRTALNALLESPEMAAPHPLPEPLIDLIAQRFRAMGEPMRVRILDALRDGPATAQDLTAQLGTTPQNISKHLGVLRGAGLVRREREGSAVLHEIADPSVIAICEQVCGELTREVRELGRLLDQPQGAG